MERGGGKGWMCVSECVCVCCRGGLGLIIALILNLPSHCHQLPTNSDNYTQQQDTPGSNSDAMQQVCLNQEIRICEFTVGADVLHN